MPAIMFLAEARENITAIIPICALSTPPEEPLGEPVDPTEDAIHDAFRTAMHALGVHDSGIGWEGTGQAIDDARILFVAWKKIRPAGTEGPRREEAEPAGRKAEEYSAYSIPTDPRKTTARFQIHSNLLIQSRTSWR